MVSALFQNGLTHRAVNLVLAGAQVLVCFLVIFRCGENSSKGATSFTSKLTQAVNTSCCLNGLAQSVFLSASNNNIASSGFNVFAILFVGGCVNYIAVPSIGTFTTVNFNKTVIFRGARDQAFNVSISGNGGISLIRIQCEFYILALLNMGSTGNCSNSGTIQGNFTLVVFIVRTFIAGYQTTGHIKGALNENTGNGGSCAVRSVVSDLTAGHVHSRVGSNSDTRTFVCSGIVGDLSALVNGNNRGITGQKCATAGSRIVLRHHGVTDGSIGIVNSNRRTTINSLTRLDGGVVAHCQHGIGTAIVCTAFTGGTSGKCSAVHSDTCGPGINTATNNILNRVRNTTAIGNLRIANRNITLSSKDRTTAGVGSFAISQSASIITVGTYYLTGINTKLHVSAAAGEGSIADRHIGICTICKNRATLSCRAVGEGRLILYHCRTCSVERTAFRTCRTFCKCTLVQCQTATSAVEMNSTTVNSRAVGKAGVFNGCISTVTHINCTGRNSTLAIADRAVGNGCLTNGQGQNATSAVSSIGIFCILDDYAIQNDLRGCVGTFRTENTAAFSCLCTGRVNSTAVHREHRCIDRVSNSTHSNIDLGCKLTALCFTAVLNSYNRTAVHTEHTAAAVTHSITVQFNNHNTAAVSQVNAIHSSISSQIIVAAINIVVGFIFKLCCCCASFIATHSRRVQGQPFDRFITVLAVESYSLSCHNRSFLFDDRAHGLFVFGSFLCGSFLFCFFICLGGLNLRDGVCFRGDFFFACIGADCVPGHQCNDHDQRYGKAKQTLQCSVHFAFVSSWFDFFVFGIPFCFSRSLPRVLPNDPRLLTHAVIANQCAHRCGNLLRDRGILRQDL